MNTTLVLDDSTIIQTDATVIAGILILLTLTSIGEIEKTSSFLESLGGFEGVTALIVVPFSLSAVTVIFQSHYKKTIESRKIRMDLLTRKIENITKQNSQNPEMKFRNELDKYQKRLNNIQKRIEKYDELKFHNTINLFEVFSIGLMMLGFTYLILVMFWLVSS